MCLTLSLTPRLDKDQEVHHKVLEVLAGRKVLEVLEVLEVLHRDLAGSLVDLEVLGRPKRLTLL